jgi:hypothetical protein
MDVDQQGGEGVANGAQGLTEEALRSRRASPSHGLAAPGVCFCVPIALIILSTVVPPAHRASL